MSTGETSPPLQAANVFSDERSRVVLLASGSGTNVKALLDAQRRDDFGARIVALVTDLPGTGAERHSMIMRVPFCACPRKISDKSNDARTEIVTALRVK